MLNTYEYAKILLCRKLETFSVSLSCYNDLTVFIAPAYVSILRIIFSRLLAGIPIQIDVWYILTSGRRIIFDVINVH